MIDHNLYNWQHIDWQSELEAYLSELANPDTTLEQCRAFRKSLGRCIMLMQEYLEPQDYEYILQACQIDPDTAYVYRKIYAWSVQTSLDAPQPPYHHNCRCELPPYDEESES